MRTIFTILFLLISISGLTQKPCTCDKNPTLKDYIKCDTTFLRNNSKLYNQFDCDSLYTLLENSKGIQYRILTMDIDMAVRYPRLHTHIKHDFDKSVLVRFGCSTNGGCYYFLFNKETGEKIATLNEPIYNDTTKDFIVYFPGNNFPITDSLVLNYINSDKKYYIKISGERLRYSAQKVSYAYNHPEYFIQDSKLIDNILTLNYTYLDTTVVEKWLYDKIIIDLIKYPR